MQKFFLEEIQLGEELLAQGNTFMWQTSTVRQYLCEGIPYLRPHFPLVTGDYEKGVDHLTNAIAVCGQPQQLLQVLQQTLPPPVFQMLLTKLPSISQVGFTGVHLHV